MKKLFKEKNIVLTILVFGIIFRFYNPNWDSGHYFHPDERNIANSVSRIQFFSQMNPKFFAYGSFPIYLYRATGEIINYINKTEAWTYDWAKIDIIGRVWSAIFSSLTLIIIYRLARKVFDKRVALLTLFFTAFTVFLIQTAHFAVTESMLAFYIVTLSYLSIQLLKEPSFSQTAKLSLFMGFALATKTSAVTFFIPPGLAFLYLIVNNLSHKHFDHALDYAFKMILFLALSSFIFFIIDPYIFLDFKHFRESMNYEGGIVTGKLVVVYVYQFIKTKAYLYWIQNWFFTQGPLLASASIVGSFYFLYLIIRKRQVSSILIFVWPLVYFTIVGNWFTKFNRYLVPLYPFLALVSSKLLIDMIYLARKQKILLLSSKLLLVFTLSTTFIYALAFMSIYTSPQTRIMASKWIYANIPSNSKILTEHWDDGLPLPIKEGSPDRYQIEALTIYEPDNTQKVTYYGEKLSSSDYIIINSKRLYGTLLYLPNKYPITSKYYKLLFDGKLGYTLVQQFTSYPRLEFGNCLPRSLAPRRREAGSLRCEGRVLLWELNDDAVEESFQVYDHPKNLIFKNTGRFLKEQLQKLLTQP